MLAQSRSIFFELEFVLKTLRHGSANMDTLVSLGSTASYLLSVVATFFPQLVGGMTFYDTTALIIILIFLGKYLEAREGAEQGSEHPLAAAIVERAKNRGLALSHYPERITALTGRGLQASRTSSGPLLTT